MKLFLFNVFMSMIHKPRFLSSDDACNVTLKREITCIHFYIMNLSVKSVPIRAGAARDVLSCLSGRNLTFSDVTKVILVHLH